MAKSKAVVSAKENLPATSDLDVFSSAPTGMEAVTAKDLLIPRLTILQGLSPQVTKGRAEFDESARAGDIYDVGVGERIGDSCLILPVHYSKVWIEWWPRKSGKGLAKIHDTDEILERTEPDEKNRPTLPNGNYVAETAQLFIINLSAQGRKSFIPFTSTQLKKVRRLITLAQAERIQRADGTEYMPPLYYRTYRLTTVPESNAEGDWSGWKVERDKALPELPKWQDLFAEARLFAESLAKGEARGDLSGMEGEGSASRRAASDDEAM